MTTGDDHPRTTSIDELAAARLSPQVNRTIRRVRLNIEIESEDAFPGGQRAGRLAGVFGILVGVGKFVLEGWVVIRSLLRSWIT